jgi:hypothetical protein
MTPSHMVKPLSYILGIGELLNPKWSRFVKKMVLVLG